MNIRSRAIRKIVLCVSAWAALTSLLSSAHAQEAAFPGKPIRLVIPFPAGGPTDALGRRIAQTLGESLGQPVVVDNKPGASGIIGSAEVARAPADGYTLLFSNSDVFINVTGIVKKMPYDPLRDFAPVSLLARYGVAMMVRPDMRDAAGLPGVLRAIQANPGKLSYGSWGPATYPHLIGEALARRAGAPLVHVPYRGAAPALQDLLAGQVDYAFDPGIGLQQVRAGKLRLLAVGSPQRSPLFPDVPTLDEAGLRGFDADTVFGFYAPAGTPPEVVAQLNAQINRALALPAVKERIASLGGEAVPGTPAEFQQRAAADSQRFGALIRERRIAAD